MSKFSFLMLWFGLVLSTLAQDDDNPETVDAFRLPGTTEPESYSLLIVPTLDGRNSSFSGDVKIVIVPNCSTKKIILNVKELIVSKIMCFELSDGQLSKEVKINKFNVAKNDQLEISLEVAIVSSSKYLLTMSFSGSMRADQTGFYMSPYVEDQVTKYIQINKE